MTALLPPVANPKARPVGARFWLCMRLLVCLVAAATCIAAEPAETPNAESPPGKRQSGDSKRANRLSRESSLYLLLHAHNPVDWYPWGPEALAKAKAEGKLIFLSIGYSSCYWCHVMERESFRDGEIAAYLNEHFVAIKVDREERPDIDEIYMKALEAYFQAAGSDQNGGWPLSMFLTPDGKPIIGATYLPPRDKEGYTGFLSALKQVHTAWRDAKPQLEQQADQLARYVRETLRRRPLLAGSLPPVSRVDEVQTALAEQFDPQHGGFGFVESNPRRPKFPEPSNLVFLLDRVERGPSEAAQNMLVLTLERMAAGGIHDHLAGGFHRYSTDRYWRVPHFEKMLYDNAQLLSVYARAAAVLKRDDFAEVARRTADFMLAELAGPDGGFIAALDAQTDGEEGVYYVWSQAELKELLGEDYDLAAEVYGLAREPNFELERYVLEIRQPLDEVAARRKLQRAALDERLAAIRTRLLEARRGRPAPQRDNKVLTNWNGLAIRGLADAGRLLNDPKYTAAAAATAGFVLEKLRTPQGRLHHSYADGQGRLAAYLDDYAFLVDGLIGLHQATGDQRWLDEAQALAKVQLDLFWDEQVGGFYFTAKDHEELLARSKDPIDNEIPSGNAISVANLVYLSKAAGDAQYRNKADQTLRAFASLLERAGLAMPRMAVSLAALHDAP